MNKFIFGAIRYIRMILLFLVLGGIVIYVAGKPIATFVMAQGNMVIATNAPVSQQGMDTDMSKLVLNTNSASKTSESQAPKLDTCYGTITCDRVKLSAPIYYGDSDQSLLVGVGQYPGGYVPGQGKPILIGGHDTTFFAPLEQIQIGDVVEVHMGTELHRYSVSSKIIAMADDKAAYDLAQNKEQLILYTCYPFGQMVGYGMNRFFVYCDPITNTQVE